MNRPSDQQLLGRERERAVLDALVDGVRRGRSGALVLSGEPGIGKTALLDRFADRIPAETAVRRIVASESEVELAYAGLQFLCSASLGALDELPPPQRDALEGAFGLRATAAPNPFLVGLAALGLLTEGAGDGGLVCIVDDAQWLDAASARAIAFIARRLEAEGIALVLSMRTVPQDFADLPQCVVGRLDDRDAHELLERSLRAPIDPLVRDRLVVEAHGNPLALEVLPRSLSPAEIAGGFIVPSVLPLERRIERGLIAQLDALPAAARRLLLLAAADPTGDPGLLWRARTALDIAPEQLDAVAAADALVVGSRVSFRHPLIRSAVYRAASGEERRRVHAALADATYVDRDPDRRAWHRASAALVPDDDVAGELERSAGRARGRGGAAAAAAFLERAAALTPDASRRVERLIAAAEATHDAGGSEAAMRLLDSASALPLNARQQALVARLRARASYALQRDGSSTRSLLQAAQALDGLDEELARDTYIEALAAALYGGRLGDPDALRGVAEAIVDATADDDTDSARDLLLRGQALLASRGQAAAVPTLQRALRAFVEHPLDALEQHWLWFASRAAQDLWDAEAMWALAERQVDLARADGMMSVLPIALSLQMVARTLAGDLAGAEVSCDEIDALSQVMGHAVPKFGRMFLAAYRGQEAPAVALIREVRADGEARGEGYALSAANFAEAILYNGLGRYREALAAARQELPYTRELNHAMRCLLELVEAASRAGEPGAAAEAVAQLAEVTEPVGTDYALGVLALAQAQLHEGDAGEPLFREAVERFERQRIPILVGRTRLVYGEMLRRQQRRSAARAELRAAHEILTACGLGGFADRAARELGATGETPRARDVTTLEALTRQELNVARLARDGLTNRDIGARLFISARTAEYHLHKVFMKLGIATRAELRAALPVDE